MVSVVFGIIASCIYSALIGGLLPCTSCSVGLRWWAGVSRACVPSMVSCSSFGLPIHAQPLRLSQHRAVDVQTDTTQGCWVPCLVTKRRSSWACISNPKPEQETRAGNHQRHTRTRNVSLPTQANDTARGATPQAGRYTCSMGAVLLCSFVSAAPVRECFLTSPAVLGLVRVLPFLCCVTKRCDGEECISRQ